MRRVERSVVVAGRKQLRWAAQLTLLTAVVVAFAPSFAVLLVLMGVLFGLATLLCGGSVAWPPRSWLVLRWAPRWWR